MTERKKLTIGLFGFGCVGYGLYRVLQQSAGFKAEIKTICVRHGEKVRPVPTENFTTDAEIILNDPDINVIVELIDDADAAFDIVKKALGKGKSVVTANKKMLAEHFEELLDLQDKTGLALLYEAAACASIPIIRNLEEYYDNDFLNRIEGIVNGSTNYILSRSLNEGMSYDEALFSAQELGYAESNPVLDVEGFDARNKLQILIAHAFGEIVSGEDIFCKGISKISECDTRYAREKGYKIKLIARAVRHDNNKISATVVPEFIKNKSPLYGVDGVYNGVITETAFADKQFFSGKGAGDFPTASAVLSDLSALSYGYRYEYKKLKKRSGNTLNDDVFCDVYVSGKDINEDIVRSYFSSVNELYRSGNSLYITGNIRLSILKSLNQDFPEISIIFQNSIQENSQEVTFEIASKRSTE